ncbi:Cap15 family cyclic dinucleotide receptor domain-containing protein [Streptomyces mirabilis]|uniref:Cap15 family cyclic dinucleotide receptor domain-containing protein n=1 Tax=Streptomyces mirabilis TaxID=68239 RepID=UPI003439956B
MISTGHFPAAVGDLVDAALRHADRGRDTGVVDARVLLRVPERGQTYWTLHATLRTAESASRSDNATIVKTDGSGIAEVRFLYDNTPRTEYRQRSPRHSGACRLSVTGRTPQSITGSYFTDRFTAGDMDLTLVDRSTDHGTFADAQTADQATAQTA